MPRTYVTTREIKDKSLIIDDIATDFLQGQDWDITGGKRDAKITNLKPGHEPYDAAVINNIFLSLDKLAFQNVVISRTEDPNNVQEVNEGDRFIIPPDATGPFENKTNQIAEVRYGDHWVFIQPSEGYICYVLDEHAFYMFNGTEWVPGPKSYSYTFTNGITETISGSSDIVKLGGAITENTLIDVTSNQKEFRIGDNASNGISFDGNTLTASISSSGSTGSTFLTLRQNNLQIQQYEASSHTFRNITLDQTKYIDINNYVLKYHSNQILDYDGRSIPDKGYIDSRSKTIAVRLKSNSNIDLSSVPIEIDGVTLQTGDLVALFDQNTTTEDGIYIVTNVSGSNVSLDRWEYVPVGYDLSGFIIHVLEGDNNGKQLFLIGNHAIVGSDDIQAEPLNSNNIIPVDNVTGSGDATQLAFFTGEHTISSSSNLYWDTSNNRLGIGTTNPLETLDVNGWIKSKEGFEIDRRTFTIPTNTPAKYYRIGIGKSRCTGTYVVRYQMSGYHGELMFTVGDAFNYDNGYTFTLYYYYNYGTQQVRKVRFLEASTYDEMYVDVLIGNSTSNSLKVEVIQTAKGWDGFNMPETISEAPTLGSGYNSHEFNVTNKQLMTKNFYVSNSGTVYARRYFRPGVGYKSSDGSIGVNTTIDVMGSDFMTKYTLTIKDGLITDVTQSSS